MVKYNVKYEQIFLIIYLQLNEQFRLGRYSTNVYKFTLKVPMALRQSLIQECTRPFF